MRLLREEEAKKPALTRIEYGELGKMLNTKAQAPLIGSIISRAMAALHKQMFTKGVYPADADALSAAGIEVRKAAVVSKNQSVVDRIDNEPEYLRALAELVSVICRHMGCTYASDGSVGLDAALDYPYSCAQCSSGPRCRTIWLQQGRCRCSQR